MSKAELKQDIQALYKAADEGAKLPALIDGICNAIGNHPEAIGETTFSYRICASDTGYTKAFSIQNGRLSPMDEMDEADVTVTGQEADLLAVFRRKVSPMSAMLRGKVKVKGSMAALVRFAEFL